MFFTDRYDITCDVIRGEPEADVLRRLLAVYLHQDSSEDLQTKAKRAMKSVIQKCTTLPALEPLLEAPPNILKYVVQQFAKVGVHRSTQFARGRFS